MDVLEEVGDDVARRCYWDFGDWSDLWRETKHVPSGVSLKVRTGSHLQRLPLFLYDGWQQLRHLSIRHWASVVPLLRGCAAAGTVHLLASTGKMATGVREMV